MSSSQFSRQNGNKQKRFSIDDAFEEETDEAIKVYGTGTHPNGKLGQGDSISLTIENGRWVIRSKEAPVHNKLIC